MSENVKITDEEALAWASALSDSDKEELKRQALLKRAIDLAQPEKAPDFGSMSDMEFETWKRQNMRQ